VTNKGRYNVTVHWHGVRQRRTGWSDGPEYVTQCPIRPGESYSYRFTVQGHAVVARTQLLAPGHRPWRPRHPPPRRRPLPFQPADQGGPHPPRYVRHYMLGRVCVNISSNMDIISLEHSTRVLHLLKLISILLMVGYT
jgi:hypothetical protein